MTTFHVHSQIPYGPGDPVDAGTAVPVQLVPFGDFDHVDEAGRHKTEHCTPETLAAVAESVKGDILVDADHASERGGSTEAMAWARNFRVDPERGLLADFLFTPRGAKAVNSRSYRFVSVAWYADDDGNPTELSTIALTNRPALPVEPILHSEEASATPDEAENTPTPKDTTHMEELKTMLGLSPEATDADVVAAVKALQDKIAEDAAKAAEAEAEQFAEDNGDRVEDKEVLKNSYLANKDLTIALVRNYKVVASRETAPAAPRVCDTAAAGTPACHSLRAQYDAMPPGQAKLDFLAAHRHEMQ